MVARSYFRVQNQTQPSINERIKAETRRKIDYYSDHPAEIPRRLLELDEEWDIERALETASAVFSLTGLTLGIVRRRSWLLLPLAIQAFFLQHSLQGWCPPLPILRRLGFRTQSEIDRERNALLDIRTPAPPPDEMRTRPRGRRKH